MMNIQEMMTTWLEEDVKRKVKQHTYQIYRMTMESHILGSLGQIDIEKLKKKDIETFLNSEQEKGNHHNGKKLSAASVKMIHVVLKGAYDYAIEKEWVEYNPLVGIKNSQVGGKKVEAFTLAEQRKIERLVYQSKDYRQYGFLLSLYTGLRIGELLALTWNDIDFQSRIITVNQTVFKMKSEDGSYQNCFDKPKTQSSQRVIPYGENIQRVLKILRTKNKVHVLEDKNNKMINTRTYQSLFERFLKNNNIRVLSFHSLRHTFATRALECQIDVKTVSELLGHENPSITLKTYAHSLIETKIQAAKRLAKLSIQ